MAAGGDHPKNLPEPSEEGVVLWDVEARPSKRTYDLHHSKWNKIKQFFNLTPSIPVQIIISVIVGSISGILGNLLGQYIQQF